MSNYTDPKEFSCFDDRPDNNGYWGSIFDHEEERYYPRRKREQEEELEDEEEEKIPFENDNDE